MAAEFVSPSGNVIVRFFDAASGSQYVRVGVGNSREVMSLQDFAEFLLPIAEELARRGKVPVST